MAVKTRFNRRILPNLERTIITPKNPKTPKREPDKKPNGHLSNEEIDKLKPVCGFVRHKLGGENIQVDSKAGVFMGYCSCSGNGTRMRCITNVRDDYYDCRYYPKYTRPNLPVLYEKRSCLPVLFKPTDTNI